jgi:adenosylhomocysteinase
VTLRVLEYFSKKHGKIYENVCIFAIQHLLMDSVDFFRVLLKHFPQDPFIIGIPYSSKAKAVEGVGTLGASVSVPAFEKIFGFTECSLAAQLAKRSKDKRKILIVEDGGYAAPVLHKPEFEKLVPFCAGVVEQTKNGLWRDKDIPAIRVPIAHVAESVLKDSVEGPAVGDAVARTLEWIFGSLGFSLASKRVAVVGYGTIGMNIAKQMKKKEATVVCNDALVLRHIAARYAGIEPMIKTRMLEEADLVIGATGTTSIGIEEILSLKHGAFLASASSKNIEIDTQGLANLTVESTSVHSEVDRYRLVSGKEVFLISKGFPVNFRGEFSIPNDVMDLIFSEMFLLILGVANGQYPNGIVGIPQDIEEEVASIWEKLYR